MSDEEAADLVSIGAQALIDRAKELGLTWTLRLATVILPKSSSQTSVIYDGDTVAIDIVNMGTYVIAGDRVYVIQVPPAGNYICGRVGGAAYAPQLFIQSDVTSSSSGTFTTTETVVQSITVPLIRGRHYRILWSVMFSSTVAGDRVVSRIREDDETGTQLAGSNVILSSANGSYNGSLRTRYTALDTADKTFVGTGQRAAGTGNIIRQATNNDSILDVYLID